MSNIQKYNQKETGLVINKNHLFLQPPVVQLTDEQVFTKVNSAIAVCFADTNTKIADEQDNQYLVNKVTDIVQNKFGSLRLDEISTAFNNGIRNVYGPYFGLSVVSFEMFLTAYSNSEQRERLAIEGNNLLARLDMKKEPTASEKFDIMKTSALDTLKNVDAGKNISIIAPSVYYFLKLINIIEFTEEEKADMRHEAVHLAYKDMEDEWFFCQDLYKKRGLRREMENFKYCVDENREFNQDHKRLIHKAAKRLAVITFMRNCLVDETDLEALIEGRRLFFITIDKEDKQQ